MDKLITFDQDISTMSLPKVLNNPFDYTPHSICEIAAYQLQSYLKTQTDWQYNFGLGLPNEDKTLKPIGKMFGVLVVRASNNRLGFLCAFSGKLANSNHLEYFVPPIFDSLSEEEFLNKGMRALKVLNTEVTSLKSQPLLDNEEKARLVSLLEKRKSHSQNLQSQLFNSYKFLNVKGEYRTPKQLFTFPPAGAGECAAPKLLQYAYLHNLAPLAMAEFWWGVPPTSDAASRMHAQYYPSCEHKCRSILGWMLN